MAATPPVHFNPVFSLFPKATVQGNVREAERTIIRSAPMSGMNVELEGSPGVEVDDLAASSVSSIQSLHSAGSILSIGSAGSILSIGSAGSVLSIGSAGSVLSIGSAGSVLSIGSALSFGGVFAWRHHNPRLVETAASLLAVAALATAALQR